MVEQKYLYSGIAGVIAILLGFGGYKMLTQDQFDRAYICPSNEEFGFFDKLSLSKVTAYYDDENGVKKSSECSVKWMSLQDYAESRGMNPDFLLSEKTLHDFHSYCCNRPSCYIEFAEKC